MKKEFEPNPVLKELIKVNKLHRSCVNESECGGNPDIHRRQYSVLMYLYKNGPVSSQKSLAEYLNISGAAVAGTLKSLEKCGCISRHADESDNRRNTVKITKKGLNIIDRSHESFRAVDNAMLKNITDKELDVFRKCLEKMVGNLDEYRQSLRRDNK